MLMPTVLIAPYSLRNQPGRFREILESAGLTPIDPDGEETLSASDLRRCLPTSDAVLAGGEVFSADLLALAPRLRVIARVGVGYDAVDVPAATGRGVAVTITPGAMEGSVAEQTFALLLALTRNVVNNHRTIQAGGWDRTLVRPLRGTTLGIVGLGRIGRAVAARARAFEMRVITFDPAPSGDVESRLGVERVDLETLLAASDVVSLHLPATPATRGMINRASLSRMKPGALLINTARGGLVVEADLYESLASGHLGGAGLDVLDPEPPRPDNPLLRLPNVVLSPHLGGIDTKGLADMATMAASCIADLYQGRWPEGCVVNDQLRPGWTW
jgi:phosphoglycerate dehydrogenase-like enzyme